MKNALCVKRNSVKDAWSCVKDALCLKLCVGCFVCEKKLV